MTINGENTKPIRTRIEVSIDIENDTQNWNIPNNSIVSCNLDLRSASTDIDNSGLQSSVIEAVFSLSPEMSERFLQQFQGKNIKIKYRAGYFNDDYSETRTFYSSSDLDSVEYSNGLIKVKGTDYVGATDDKLYGKVIKDAYRATYNNVRYGDVGNLINSYMYSILKPFLTSLAQPNPPYRPAGTIYKDVPQMYITDSTYRDMILTDSSSKRRLVAQWMNFFRGKKNGTLKDLNSMKFIFRDAGRPEAGWFATSTATTSETMNLNTWEIDYKEVCDFKKFRDEGINQISIKNSNVMWLTGVQDPDSSRSGYKLIENKATEAGRTYIISLPEAFYDVQCTGNNRQLLGPKTFKFTATITGITKIEGIPIQELQDAISFGESQEGETIIPINAGKKDVPFDEFKGLRTYTYKTSYSSSSTLTAGLADYIQSQYSSDDIMNPTYIEFKWRGHPNMQPRDILAFTEKDGTVNYYEIDSVSLEHKQGGLISEIKAMYREAA